MSSWRVLQLENKGVVYSSKDAPLLNSSRLNLRLWKNILDKFQGMHFLWIYLNIVTTSVNISCSWKKKIKLFVIFADFSVIEVSVFSKFLVLKSTMGRVLKKENGSTFSFPMQPFSTLWKHQKTKRFFNAFRECR